MQVDEDGEEQCDYGELLAPGAMKAKVAVCSNSGEGEVVAQIDRQQAN